MADTIPVLLSAFVGGAIGFFASWGMKIVERRHERLALANALAGEIGAIVEIVERREYLEDVRKTITQIRATHQVLIFRVRVSQNVFSVYEANALQVGLLPTNVARDVARFYILAKSLIEEVTTDDSSPRAEAEALRGLEQLAEFIISFVALGKDLTKKLESV